MKLLDEQIAIPLPGRQVEVTQETIDDEMALFKSAQATMGR